MTYAEANAEAKRRWGPDAFAKYHKGARTYIVCRDRYETLGGGESYEAAFADADRRAK